MFNFRLSLSNNIDVLREKLFNVIGTGQDGQEKVRKYLNLGGKLETLQRVYSIIKRTIMLCLKLKIIFYQL